MDYAAYEIDYKGRGKSSYPSWRDYANAGGAFTSDETRRKIAERRRKRAEANAESVIESEFDSKSG